MRFRANSAVRDRQASLTESAPPGRQVVRHKEVWESNRAEFQKLSGLRSAYLLENEGKSVSHQGPYHGDLRHLPHGAYHLHEGMGHHHMREAAHCMNECNEAASPKHAKVLMEKAGKHAWMAAHHFHHAGKHAMLHEGVKHHAGAMTAMCEEALGHAHNCGIPDWPMETDASDYGLKKWLFGGESMGESRVDNRRPLQESDKRMTLAQAHELLKKAHSLPEKTHMDHWRKADAFDKVVHEFDHNVIPATEREYYDMGSTSKDASSHAAHHYREAAKGATDPYDSESLHYSAKEHERKSEGRAREGDPPPVAPYRSFY